MDARLDRRNLVDKRPTCNHRVDGSAIYHISSQVSSRCIWSVDMCPAGAVCLSMNNVPERLHVNITRSRALQCRPMPPNDSILVETLLCFVCCVVVA